MSVMIKIYGQTDSKNHPSEMNEMITFFNVLKRDYPHLARIATHIKNEGKRDYRAASYEKMSGMVKGFADIIIVGCPPFICEMKSRNKGAKLSDYQKRFLEDADKTNAFVCIAYGYEAALEAMREWLDAQRRQEVGISSD